MLPGDFLERMRGMLGEEYGAFLGCFDGEHLQGLDLNPGKIGTDGQNAAERFGAGTDERNAAECFAAAWRSRGECPGAGVTGDGMASGGTAEGADTAGFARLSKVPWAENGYYYEMGDQPGKHPFHEAGLYYIQEPSAMMPVGLLEVRPGERILDLCAAPGGKSVQIAAALRGRGILVCNEIHPARAKILAENIERMGIGNVCVLNETPERLAEVFAGYFDRILVDAPCSGEGMFRRNETAVREWSPENVELCARRQDGILDCAAGMLRAGGRMVYSTCTFAPEEDEGSVSRFLRRHGEFGILLVDKERLGLSGCNGVSGYVEDPAPGLEETVRLWPHKVRGEGHFAAALGKEGIIPDCHTGSLVRQFTKEAEKAVPEEFRLFCAENLRLSKGNASMALSETERGAGQNAVQDTGSGKGQRRREASAEKRTKAKGNQRPQTFGAPDMEEMLCALGRATGLNGLLTFMNFGDNLYLIPGDMPSLKGLKVLRPGLHLGEMKKNRFEPSHALALALDPRSAAHVWNLDACDPTVSAYLNGQTFPAEGEKGWYLICVEGFGLGWGKLAAGSMKNHYPRGLRR